MLARRARAPFSTALDRAVANSGWAVARSNAVPCMCRDQMWLRIRVASGKCKYDFMTQQQRCDACARLLQEGDRQFEVNGSSGARLPDQFGIAVLLR